MSNYFELSVPCSNLENAKTIFDFGADAIYCGIKNLSRAKRVNEFSFEDLKKAVTLSHLKRKKLYVALNTVPSSLWIKDIVSITNELYLLNVDGVIVSDIGLIHLIKKNSPDLPIHISIGSTVMNFNDIYFYQEIGVKRIILSPYVDFEEIQKIADIAKKINIELEIFIYGNKDFFILGKCWLGSYFLIGKNSSSTDISRCSYMLIGSAKRSGVCSKVCYAQWNSNNQQLTTNNHFQNTEHRTQNTDSQFRGTEAQRHKGTEDFSNNQQLITNNKYGTQHGATYYDLSPELLNLTHLIERLFDRGIKIFKIGGRDISFDKIKAIVENTACRLEKLKKQDKG